MLIPPSPKWRASLGSPADLRAVRRGTRPFPGRVRLSGGFAARVHEAPQVLRDRANLAACQRGAIEGDGRGRRVLCPFPRLLLFIGSDPTIEEVSEILAGVAHRGDDFRYGLHLHRVLRASAV